jgi:hypothetical protein
MVANPAAPALETHLVRNPDDRTVGSFIRAPVSAEVPTGYVPLGTIHRRGMSQVDYIYQMEQAGYPALWRRSDDMVVARDRITAREADGILWSERAATHIFVWAPTTPRA